ncbi:MAG: hypothetical protein K2R98_19220 [Gemmataceae bacterium]|nr:hypothetical protein [Gemmataceae bacterium]
MPLPETETVDYLDHDLACAVALGIVEHRWVRVTLEAITLLDARMQLHKVEAEWLTGDDPLKEATRRYLEARRALSRGTIAGPSGAWSMAAAARARDASLRQALEAKSAARRFLVERDAFARAKALGMTILES